MKITNDKILKVLRENRLAVEELMKETEAYDLKMHALNKSNHVFVDLMNEEYGPGEWQAVNAVDETFTPKEEFTKQYYIVANPSLKEKIEALRDSDPSMKVRQAAIDALIMLEEKI